MTILLKSANVATAVGLEKFRRDAALVGDNGGVKFLFDLPSTAGWPGQDAPVAADVIPNVATTTGLMIIGDGAFDIAAGQAISFAGGGFDFSALTADPAVVKAPSGALQSIWDAANDYFMVVGYFQLPTSGDWNTSVTLAPMFCCTDGANGYATPEADLLTIAQASGGILSFRRSTASGVATATTIAVAAGAFGNLAQISFYRDSSGAHGRLRTATTDQITTVDAGGNNSGDFSLKRARWGVPGSFNALPGVAAHLNAANHRLYRGWIEDLSISGRDPTTVLDADWARVQARKTASGDAIFV